MQPINPDSVGQLKQKIEGGIRYPLLYMCAVIDCPNRNKPDRIKTNCIRCILLNVSATQRNGLRNLLGVVNETNQS